MIFLFYFALPLIVLEKNGVFKSFENSVKLVWGSWWFTFGILLIVHFVVIAIGLLVTSIIPSRDIIILALWNFIFSIFAYPLIISTTLTLLHHLKLRHPNVGQAI